MSEAVAPDLFAPSDAARPMPRAKRARDAVLPIVAALSLIVHATVLIPFLFQGKKAAEAAPTEIPVEIVQEPPPRIEEAPKPVAKPDPPKPPKPPRQQKSAEEAKRATAQARVSERLRQLLGRDPPNVDPGVILPGEAPNGTDAVSYEQRVLSKLARSVNHDVHVAVGFATVAFRLGDTGEIVSIDVVEPSGDAALDREAVAAVRRGAPFPPPPPGGKRVYTVTLQSKIMF